MGSSSTEIWHRRKLEYLQENTKKETDVPLGTECQKQIIYTHITNDIRS